ncbi:hypothetical protein [Methylotuvimicrobium sp. KM1]|uniref:hypothetical protein n=1 Tax=Methylotuvimicrobium sp. KM1 TaxID=3377707 RepID=UPI0038506572
MTGKVKTPDQIKRAILLREVGYTLASITEQTGISPTTLARHFRTHKPIKGTLKPEAIAEARRQLIEDGGLVNELKHQIASTVVDDYAQFLRLREATTLTLEELMNDGGLPAHYKTRGLAAIATTLRLSQELARKALGADNLQPEPTALPELTVRELTVEEIEGMRQEQRELSTLFEVGNSPDDDEVVEEFDDKHNRLDDMTTAARRQKANP